MKVGTSKKQREELTSTNVFEDQIKLNEGVNRLRFIQGPQSIRTVYLPVVKEVEEDGKTKLKPSFTVFNYKESSGMLNQIANAERAIHNSLGTEKAQIRFAGKLNWFYLAIDLQDKTGYKVRPIKVPKSVKDEIVRLETLLDLEDPDYLLNGLYFMYDILVEKVITPGKPKRYGTEYKVSIYGNNEFQGEVPQSYLEEGSIFDVVSKDKIFKKPEIIEAIESCELDLEEVLKPDTEDEITTKLLGATINFSYRGADGEYYFPQVEEFREELVAMGLNVVDFDEEEVQAPAKRLGNKTNNSGIKTGGKKVKEEPVDDDESTNGDPDEDDQQPEEKPKPVQKLRSLKKS